MTCKILIYFRRGKDHSLSHEGSVNNQTMYIMVKLLDVYSAYLSSESGLVSGSLGQPTLTAFLFHLQNCYNHQKWTGIRLNLTSFIFYILWYQILWVRKYIPGTSLLSCPHSSTEGVWWTWTERLVGPDYPKDLTLVAPWHSRSQVYLVWPIKC